PPRPTWPELLKGTHGSGQGSSIIDDERRDDAKSQGKGGSEGAEEGGVRRLRRELQGMHGHTRVAVRHRTHSPADHHEEPLGLRKAAPSRDEGVGRRTHVRVASWVNGARHPAYGGAQA